MSIERLIESLGMSAGELKLYLLAEIEEFLEAAEPTAQDEEFEDILFALTAMAWAHTGRHPALERENVERKLKRRLRTHAAVTRHPRLYHDDRIPELAIGVLHFAGSSFGGQWQRFDALRNGTVAEIAMLTDAPFGQPQNLTNHCIVTFGGNAAIEYDILSASESMDGGNTIRCRIPDFMFAEAKRALRFSQYAELLSSQVLAGLEGLRIAGNAIAHFHSWENGFLAESPEFLEFVQPLRTMFSPYLTVSRLRSLVEEAGGEDWTMTPDEIVVGSEYERRLGDACDRVVVESERDRAFYATILPPERLDVRSFALDSTTSFSSAPADPGHLRFLAGGRPVREKGFAELCRAFGLVRDWAAEQELKVSLSILCRERRRDKGARYIADLEQLLAEHELDDVATIEPKVPLEVLHQRIADSSAVIVPSLYDPFCLMPTYAVAEDRPAFVSTHAGVSESIRSREFVFDPKDPDDLLRAIDGWYRQRPEFVFEAPFPSYEGLYLDETW